MKGREWAQAEVERLMSLRQEAYHTEDIAKLLGRTDQAVRLKLHALGYSSVNVRRAIETDPPGHVALEDWSQAREAVEPKHFGSGLRAQPGTEVVTTVAEDIASAREGLVAAEIRALERKYEHLLRMRSMEDRIVDLFDSRLEFFRPSTDFLAPRDQLQAIEPSQAEAAVLLLSDLHIGQNVSAEQTFGMGTYNIRRYCERLSFLEDEVLSLLRHRSAFTDELVIFLLGDLLHGTLNHGAEREETLLLADQFQLALWTLHQFVTRLASAVPTLRIYTTVGNHGRLPTQRKMPTVARFSNFDHLLYSALHQSFESLNSERIQFVLNTAPRQVVRIKNAQFLASHGDHLRGGDKQTAIPLPAITREINITAQRHAAAKEAATDYFVIGDKHKHASLPLPGGAYIMNGSFVGADEFSAYNFVPADPVQLLFWVHPTYKKTWQYEVKLQFAPRLTTLRYHLPERISQLLEQYAD